MYSRYLPEGVVCFSFGALCRVYDIENALLVRPYTLVLFATIPEPCLAEEIFPLVKSNANMNLQSCFNRYFFWKYDVHHPVLYLCYREVLV